MAFGEKPPLPATMAPPDLLVVADHTLAMSQSDTSLSRVDSFSSSLATTGSRSATALSLGSTSLSVASLASATSPGVDASSGAIVTQSFPTLAIESNGTIFTTDAEPAIVSSPNANIDVDPQILEALKNKDRIYVLKLGETFEALIKERRNRVEVSHSTSYQRLLVHRCSAYYKLQPENDPLTKALYVILTSESKIPERRICELVPAESPTQPAIQIMKREARSKPQSHTGSVAGDDADLSDVEASESGSLSGQSYNTNSSTRKRMTIEEREAAYNEARSRIFMGFEEKEKVKEMNATSSTLSVSGSTSSTGRSYIGDTDDTTSSPGTESEWSMPTSTFNRDVKRDGRRGIPPSTSSSRGLRSGGPFHGNSSGNSSRNSRAASPSFSYPSLYEPNPQGLSYDAPHPVVNPGYHPTQYSYPFPPNQGPNPPYLPPYPYYPPHYPLQPPPPMSQHIPPDSSSPTGHEPFPQHPQMGYMPPYGWAPQPPSNQPSMQPPQCMHPPIPPHPQNPMHQIGPLPPPPPPPPSHSIPYQPYMHPPHAYSYPMNQVNSYYSTSPPGQQPLQGPPPPQMPLQPQSHPYDPRAANPNTVMQPPLECFGSHPQLPNHTNYNNGSGLGHGGPRAGLGNGIIQPNARPLPNRSSSSGSGNSGNTNSSKRAPAASRPTWSSGPGAPMSGFPCHLGGGGMIESVGPRFNSRRTSGNTSSGGNSCASSTTNNDDVSSIASSSTTSSSSRRTYTSTTSSQQHPLPARPDWAVGLKAQPTLASRHHDHSLNNSRNMSPISPSKSNGQISPHSGNNNASSNNSPRHPQSSHQPPVSLRSTDFPPLTANAAAQEKRVPVATGAWAASRPMLSPNLNGNISAPQSLRGEETIHDHRCKPGELYTPKLARRPVHSPGINNNQAARLPPIGKVVKTDSAASLAGQVASMTLGGEHVASNDGILPAINNNPSATVGSSPGGGSAP